MIRQPIVSVLGHVDHGKTSILDRIRGSAVAQKEAGGITQHIGATEIPMKVLDNLCGKALREKGIKLTIPGLLFIDTPGHEAFTTLRKRGGALADLAVLVVDINEGLMPQTKESISILKHTKTPFIIAANKIDLTKYWLPQENAEFLKTMALQRDVVQEELDNKIYTLVGAMATEGFNSDRFDRVTEFNKQIAIVPVSAKTGEGMSDLLMLIAGLAQRFLGDKLVVSEDAKGTVLEMKKEKGMGTTIDLILYDGKLAVGDEVLLYTFAGVITTKIKSLLKPEELVELKSTRRFVPVKEAYAASGIKITAPGIDEVIAGSPLRKLTKGADIDKLKAEVASEIESVKIETTDNGVILKSDTLGALEALISMFTNAGIKIRRADIGSLTKADIADASIVKKEDMFLGVVFAFNTEVPQDVELKAGDLKVKLFKGNIVYRLLEEYQEWKTKEYDEQKKQKLSELTRPGVIRLLPGYVFRQSNPAVVGVEVVDGIVRPRVTLLNASGEPIGNLKEIQVENEPAQEIKKGQRGAVSITGATVGRQIKEGDELYVDIPISQIETLKNLKNLLTESEINALSLIQQIKSKVKQ